MVVWESTTCGSQRDIPATNAVDAPLEFDLSLFYDDLWKDLPRCGVDVNEVMAMVQEAKVTKPFKLNVGGGEKKG
jgi:hypothetical protein